MIIVDSPLSWADLKAMAERTFGDMVKAVVDIERGVMALDGELHSDEEALLLGNGSKQEHLWGINLYPGLEGPDRIEFDSVINIRPSQNNRSRGVDSLEIRDRIIQIVGLMVKG